MMRRYFNKTVAGAFGLATSSRTPSAQCDSFNIVVNSSTGQCRFQSSTWEARRSRPWMCVKPECHTINHTRSPECESCAEPKPNLLGWGCPECGTRNHKGIKACKKCQAPSALAEGFWCCAACNKNNKVDMVDDNSRCGHCGYDMAPMTRSEAEILQKAQERSEMLQMQEDHYNDLKEEADDTSGGFGSLKGGDVGSLAEGGNFWKNTEETTSQPIGNDFSEFSSAIPAPPPSAPADDLDMPNYKNMTYDYGEGSDEVQKSGDKGAAAVTPGLKSHTKSIPKPKLVAQLNRKDTSQLPTRKPRLGSDTPMGPPGFEWMCRECGQQNPGDTEGCQRCDSLIVPSEWVCGSCGGKNHRSRGKCFDCQEKIQASWSCNSCRNETSVYDQFCRTCRSPRPDIAQITREEMPMYGIGPKAPKQPPGRGGAARTANVDWFCMGCRTKNFHFRDRCFGCDLPKPGSEKATPQGGSSGGFGDWGGAPDSDASQPKAVGDNNWMCRFCRATNFRTRTECWQCKKPATHLGNPNRQQTTMPDSPQGFAGSSSEPQFAKEGFQPGHEDVKAPGSANIWGKRDATEQDWVCTKCFSTNFKSKKECFKCGAVKSAQIMPKIQPKKPVKL